MSYIQKNRKDAKERETKEVNDMFYIYEMVLIKEKSRWEKEKLCKIYDMILGQLHRKLLPEINIK